MLQPARCSTCAVNMCHNAKIFAHLANICMIKTSTFLTLGCFDWSSRHRRLSSTTLPLLISEEQQFFKFQIQKSLRGSRFQSNLERKKNKSPDRTKTACTEFWYKLKSDLHLSNKVAQTIAHRIFMREVPSSNPVFANLASFIQNFKIYSKYVILELTKHEHSVYTQSRTGGRHNNKHDT